MTDSRDPMAGRPRRKPPPFIAISDDMTGAAACAGELTRSSRDERVVLRSWTQMGPIEPHTLVVDTASRLQAASEARRRVAGVIGDLRAAFTGLHETQWYKRVDSRLRGNIITEIDAMRESLQLPVVLATAAPSLGIVTSEGVQRKLIGKRESSLPSSWGPSATDRILDWVPGAIHVSGSVLRTTSSDQKLSSELANGRSLVVDAKSMEDLAVAASIFARIRRLQPFLLVGSYGLAGLVHEQRITSATSRAPAKSTSSPTLVLVGSTEPASRAQADVLELTGTLTVKPWQRFVSNEGRILVADRLAQGGDVLVRLATSHVAEESPMPATAVGKAVASVLNKVNPAGLVIVGGEMASSVARSCGMLSADVIAEPWPATPVILMNRAGRRPLPTIIKSGGVGEPSWLLHALNVLRQAGRQSLDK